MEELGEYFQPASSEHLIAKVASIIAQCSFREWEQDYKAATKRELEKASEG